MRPRNFPLRLIPICFILASAAQVHAAEPGAAPQSTQERGSYSLGYKVGKDLQRQGMDLDHEVFVKGVRDALTNAEPRMDEAARQAAMNELRVQVAKAQQEKQAKEGERKRAAGSAFMADNAKKPGVKSTPSGMQYLILSPGTGKRPAATDSVTVHYRGTLVDGKEFDSSYNRNQPASFPLSGVIAGWTEGLQLIQEGGKIKLYVPPELAYADQGQLAHETLVFEVELLSVQAAAP